MATTHVEVPASCFPPPRRHRRQREIHSSPCWLQSPADSGYDSGPLPATPSDLKPCKLEKEQWLPIFYPWPSIDGTVSTHSDEGWGSGEEIIPETPSHTILDATPTTPPPPKKPLKRTTFPRISPRSRPGLPASFHSNSGVKPRRTGSKIGMLRTRANSFRQPDRFIPTRGLHVNIAESFRTNKGSHKLTTLERLLRHNEASTDAFCFRRRTVAPMASDFRTLSRSDSGGNWSRIGTVLGPIDHNIGSGLERQPSHGTVWAVGGLAPGGTAINNGRGQLVGSGTNARLFRTSFSTAKPTPEEELEKHEARIASALGMDRASRILQVPGEHQSHKNLRGHSSKYPPRTKTTWNGTEWVNEGPVTKPAKQFRTRLLPNAPFKVLDAPNLRDDFYCSVLAYSQTSETLAVGLGNQLYGWSESGGVRLLNDDRDPESNEAHLTSLAFSSTQGRKSILAFGRSDRTLRLIGMTDAPEGVGGRIMARFKVDQPAPITCLSWKPTCTIRPSEAPYNSHPDCHVQTKDLLVGNDTGHVYYYSVEWPDRWEVERYNWLGVVRLRARIAVHAQQICGLSWSSDGRLFATGGNDNLCFLFQTSKITDSETNHGSPHQHLDSRHVDANEVGDGGNPIAHKNQLSFTERLPLRRTSTDDEFFTRSGGSVVRQERTSQVPTLEEAAARHKWTHGAAVKAIAFCPWQDGLVATGGGSNDKCIHFFHSTTGAALATISVSAQVTSLIWSTTRKEIAATFGYTQPEHSVRIAVFSWPDCRQVAAIPWMGHHRALYAIPYPMSRERGGPAVRGSVISTRTATDGSIIVASSDGSVKFHEIWSNDRKTTTVGGARMLGGSDILDSLEGIDKEGDVIR